jgi:hypothetical protein
MSTILSVILVGFIFAIIDLVPLYKEEQWVSFFLYVTLLGIALIIGILLDFKVVIPSPAEPIKKIVSFIFGLE